MSDLSDDDLDALHQRLMDGSFDPHDIDRLPDANREAARAVSDGLRHLGVFVKRTSRDEVAQPPATTADRYEVMEEIGHGGQGIVFRARDRESGELVALKVLDATRRLSADAVGRLRRESRLLARLSHPGLQRLRDVGDGDTGPWIVSDFVEGRTLAAWIAEGRPAMAGGSSASSEEILWLMSRVAAAVGAAHALGIVHRDIKPQNILITLDGEPVVMDFGLGRELEADTPNLTMTGDLLGTPAYLAPEQLTRQGIAADRRTDVWALGASLFETLTGRRPFDEPTREALFSAILVREPTPLRRLRPDVSRDVEVVVQTALEKDRDRRYSDATALAEELERCLARRPIRSRPASRLRRVTRWVERHPLAATSVGLSFALALSLGFLAARWRDIERGRESRHAMKVESLLTEGYLALGEGDADDALSRFEEAAEASDGAVEALAGLALAELRRGDVARANASLGDVDDHALEPIRALIEGRPSTSADASASSMSRFIAGESALTRGHGGDVSAFAAAVDHFHAAVLLAPAARPLFHFELLHAAKHAGRADVVATLVDSNPARWPDSPHAAFWSGFALIDDDPAAAARWLEEALRRNSALAVARLNLIHALLKLERIEDALAFAKEAIVQRPTDAEAALAMGSVYLAMERGDLAGPWIGKTLEQRPRDARALAAMAAGKRLTGDLLGAEEAAEAALGIDEESAAGHMERGLARLARGELDGGFDDLRLAISRAPNDISYRVSLVRALARFNRRDHVADAARQLGGMAKGKAAANATVAMGLALGGFVDEADALLEGVNAADLTTPLALADWLRALVLVGETKRALQVLEADDDDDPSMVWLEGSVLYAEGRMAEAAARFEAADRLGATRADWREDARPLIDDCNLVIGDLARVNELRTGTGLEIDKDRLMRWSTSSARAQHWDDLLWLIDNHGHLLRNRGGLHPFSAARIQALAGRSLASSGADARRDAEATLAALAEFTDALDTADIDDLLPLAAIQAHASAILNNVVMYRFLKRIRVDDPTISARFTDLLQRLR